MTVPAQPVQVACPQCRQPFIAHVHTVIDVGENPHLKEELLRGQLNFTQCPSCGAGGHLGAPLLYHDPDKELCLALVPLDLQLNAERQERLIGSLTNALMDSLPPEQRRAYMLQPETHLSIQSFAEAILMADGITREMLDAQARRLQLIQDFVDAGDNQERLQAMVAEHRDQLDYEFFLILNEVTVSTRDTGDEVTTRRLIKLRERLLALTGSPADVSSEPWSDEMTAEEVIQTLLATPEGRLPQLVEMNRPAFDYGFFERLTSRIESAEQAGDTADSLQLRTLRDRLVELTIQIDRRIMQAVQQAVDLLGEILDADDPKQMIRDSMDRIDDTFMIVLTANIAEARSQGDHEAARVLEGLYGYILSQLEEQMPPGIRLVNRLLRIPDAEERARTLEEEKDLVTQGLVELVNALGDDARRGGQIDLSERLAVLAGEVEAELESRRA